LEKLDSRIVLGEKMKSVAMRIKGTGIVLSGMAGLICSHAVAAADAAAPAVQATVTVHTDQAGKAISPDLFGIFFEDLNYAADGGLYAELIQNRSFEYQDTEQPSWNSLTGWEVTTRGGGKGSVVASSAAPVHGENPHYAVLRINQAGDGVGLINAGFDGISVQAGDSYDVSLFARQLYGTAGPLVVRLESATGTVYGEATLQKPSAEWRRLSATIKASQTDHAARFVLLATAPGAVAFDVISLFPQKTFHNRPNGLRADIAKTIADLKPKFIRFPGGCLAHGDGLGNMYRWKNTIGPIEQRREQANIWRYHQTTGLGYFEYFQFCEDIGAKPLPVVPAGVCCQNSSYTHETGQEGLPMDQMPAYVQEVLDLVEYANGPVNSKWGAKRAAAGHPAPFHLQYLGVGNEDAQTPVFRERFQMIHDALKKKHPEIIVIGTVGPYPSGADFDAGWKFANQLRVNTVDEHYYQNPDWFLANLGRYDSYDRSKSKVYVGEYASRGNTLFNALAEAAYMTSLERNGDVVRMASYAPLLAKTGHTQWNTDLIYFTNTTVTPSINYYVQQMFGGNGGDAYLPDDISDGTSGKCMISSVKDSRTGDVILKLVNIASTTSLLHIHLTSVKNLDLTAVKTVLAGDPAAINRPESSDLLLPTTSNITIGAAFDYEAPASSFTVIRMTAHSNKEN
jgi:alpha-N-arabinofuranosidase